MYITDFSLLIICQGTLHLFPKQEQFLPGFSVCSMFNHERLKDLQNRKKQKNCDSLQLCVEICQKNDSMNTIHLFSEMHMYADIHWKLHFFPAHDFHFFFHNCCHIQDPSLLCNCLKLRIVHLAFQQISINIFIFSFCSYSSYLLYQQFNKSQNCPITTTSLEFLSRSCHRCNFLALLLQHQSHHYTSPLATFAQVVMSML